MPSASVTTVRVTFVSTLRAVTVAAGTTSPWLSITTPWMVPVMDCAASGTAQASAANTQQNERRTDAVLMTPPPIRAWPVPRTPPERLHPARLHSFDTAGLRRHPSVIQRYGCITTRGGSMILVPKIGPHGLFVPHRPGLFLQIAESAQLKIGRAHV